jgi:hypothetical protein
MFSTYEKIFIKGLNEYNIANTLNNVNKEAIVIYNNQPLVSKHLFQKGIEGINFVCDNVDNIIKVGKPDLIIIESTLQQSIIDLCKKNSITIFNYKNRIGTCGRCGKETVYLNSKVIGKTCSEECSLLDHPGLYDMLSSCKLSNYQDSNLVKSFSNTKESIDTFKRDEDKMTEKEIKKADKFQKLMVLEAKRHAYMTRKEEYKRSFKSGSNSKGVKFDDDETDNDKLKDSKKSKECNQKMCKAKTKKESKPCSNKAINGSDYCGIVGHRKLDPNYDPNKKTSNGKSKIDKIRQQMKRSGSKKFTF